MAGIRPDLIGFGGVWQESGHFGRIRPNMFPESSDDGGRTLPDSSDGSIFAFRDFFVRTKRRKIFSRKLYFLKMISSKIFYDENHFTSKQTEHSFST
jgi:hypothetical protein